MKFFTSLLAGAASATSIEGHLKYYLGPEVTTLATVPIGNGVCQAYDGFTLFDLKSFTPGLAANSTTPLNQDGPALTNENFVFNLCAVQLGTKGNTLEDSWTKAGHSTYARGSCDNKASALWNDGESCKYSFNGAIFNGLSDVNGTNTGFSLDWTSEEKTCTFNGTTGFFNVTLNANCNADATAAAVNVVKMENTCQAVWEHTSHDACGVTIPIMKYISKLAPFIGAIMLGLGLVMTFFGSRFIQLLGASVVGLIVSLVVMGIGYNVLPTSSGMGVLIVLLLVAIAVGAGVAKLAWNFIKQWAVAIMMAAASVAGVLVFCGVINVSNNLVKIALVFVAIIAGGFIGKKLNKGVKTFGTAFVGAFLVIRGLSTFIGGWPGDEDHDHHDHHDDHFGKKDLKHAFKHHKLIFAYLGGFVFLFIAGALVQLRMIRDEDVNEEDKDDAFQDQDEGRTCGCF